VNTMLGAELFDQRAQLPSSRSKVSGTALIHLSTVHVRGNIEVSFANQN
jgi:hypothetical protein